MKLTSLILLVLTAVPVHPEVNLNAWYEGYNHAYFNDTLPATVVISHNLHDDRFMALTEYANGFYHIEFNPKYEPSPKQARETLLHEQCHLEQLVSGEVEFEDHGPKWQACMHRLANQGALEDLW
jgi:predicted SprT family Zn-dependent metalloprotease